MNAAGTADTKNPPAVLSAEDLQKLDATVLQHIVPATAIDWRWKGERPTSGYCVRDRDWYMLAPTVRQVFATSNPWDAEVHSRTDPTVGYPRPRLWPQKSVYNYREAWLQEAAALILEDVNSRCGIEFEGQIRVSVGFPMGSRGGANSTAIGQAFSPTVAADGHAHLFVHPQLENPYQVIAILAHEICHAVVVTDAGHGPAFRRCAVAMGLGGSMRATEPTIPLIARCNLWAPSLGAYPHGALTDNGPRQTTRMIRCECPHCGFLMRASSRWVGEREVRCPDPDCKAHRRGGKPMVVDL